MGGERLGKVIKRRVDRGPLPRPALASEPRPLSPSLVVGTLGVRR